MSQRIITINQSSILNIFDKWGVLTSDLFTFAEIFGGYLDSEIPKDDGEHIARCSFRYFLRNFLDLKFNDFERTLDETLDDTKAKIIDDDEN